MVQVENLIGSARNRFIDSFNEEYNESYKQISKDTCASVFEKS